MVARARLLLGTNNAGKLREFRALLADLPVELVTPAEAGIQEDAPETGATFTENAELKARFYAQRAGMVALADDSGLQVDALDGEPGVHSRRFAGEQASDADRNRLILERLREVPPARRAARFQAAAAVAVPDGQVHSVLGTCEGQIALQPRGAGGFGYDPIFLLPELGRTMAELSPEAKNGLSHRGRALRAARPLICRALGLAPEPG